MAENRVTVTADGQVQLTYTATNEEPRRRLYHTLTSMLGKLGMQERHLRHNAYLQNPIPVAGVAHQAGTCRFGADPASSRARRQLQGPRARQPVRRGHELLSEHRRGEPGADGDGERPAGWASTCSSAWRDAGERGAPMAAEHNGRAPGSGRRRVVIVGGGFGGLTAARALGGADVDVTLVDRHSHHLFQPLLYQLACGGLSPVGVRHPDPGARPPRTTTSSVLMAPPPASTPSGASCCSTATSGCPTTR